MGEMREYNPEAVEMYKQGLSAYLAGDREGALRFARATLVKDPSVTEATRMIERLAPPVRTAVNPLAVERYRKGLDSYLGGNVEDAGRYASEAISINPGMVEAQRMLDRIRYGKRGAGVSPVEALSKAMKRRVKG